MPDRLRQLVLPVLFAAALLPYFVDLGGSSIWDANEAFYVETPREMMERGDYVFPMFNYEPRLNKPVLSYWIVAGLYKAFGVSVGVQRLGITIGAMLIIVAGMVLGSIAGPKRRPGLLGPAALLAAIGLAADPRLFMFARRIFIDMWISAFMALILLFFALSEHVPARRRLYLVLMYVCVGLGVLTKGPIAVALPGLVFALYLIVHKELRRVTTMMIPLGAVIVLAIVVPWYFALYQRDGWEYIVQFFLGENVGRFVRGIGQPTPRPWYFYPPVVLGDAFPLSLFLVPAAVLWWKTRERLLTLLWLWILAIVLFFSFSHDKQDLYIFPIVPAVAALGAAAIARRDEVPRTVTTTAVVLGVVLTLLGAAVFYVFEGPGRIYAIEGAAVVGGAAIVGGLAAVLFALRRSVDRAVVAVLVALVIANWTFVLRVLPSFEQYKPAPKLSNFLRPKLRPGDRIAHFNVAMPSMVFYLQHHVKPYYSAGEFKVAMREPDRIYAMLTATDYEGMKEELAGRTCVLHRVPTFDVKLKNILARQPLPEILLITNRCD
jgi:4-amino-4-deoxy-L-arabinose transferase-like glycosyltransferase